MNLQGEVLLMRFGNLFSRYRAVSKWSGLLAAIAMALLTVAASAQMVGSEKGKKHRDTQKTEDQAKKKKVDEKAYEDALKSIPPERKVRPLEKYAIRFALGEESCWCAYEPCVISHTTCRVSRALNQSREPLVNLGRSPQVW